MLGSPTWPKNIVKKKKLPDAFSSNKKKKNVTKHVNFPRIEDFPFTIIIHLSFKGEKRHQTNLIVNILRSYHRLERTTYFPIFFSAKLEVHWTQVTKLKFCK